MYTMLVDYLLLPLISVISVFFFLQSIETKRGIVSYLTRDTKLFSVHVKNTFS